VRARECHLTQLAYFNGCPYFTSTHSMEGLYLKGGLWSSEEVNALYRVKTKLDACAAHRPQACARGLLELLQDNFAELQKAVFFRECSGTTADSVQERTALFAHVVTIEAFMEEEANLNGLKTEHQVALCNDLQRACGRLAAATPTVPPHVH
jgi:hypothetical protein